jgi:hypothetical protein
MKSIGGRLRTRPARLHALIAALATANGVAPFSFPWLTGLVLRIASLLVVFFFVYTDYRAGIR